MSELQKLYWELFKSLLGLVGAIVSLAGFILAVVKATHGEYSEATFLLALVIMWRVFDLPGKRRG
jgi:hypothetical protein